MKTPITLIIISILLIALTCTCDKEESKYPIELNLTCIEQGDIKAYTKTDSIIPNNFTYESIDEFDYFNKFLIKSIAFKSCDQAILIYGDFDPEDEIKDSLRLNASVSYLNDSIFFSGNENIDGWDISVSLSGIGNEYGIEFDGTHYIKLYPYGLDGSVIFENFNLEQLRNELNDNDTLIFYHFNLTYE